MKPAAIENAQEIQEIPDPEWVARSRAGERSAFEALAFLDGHRAWTAIHFVTFSLPTAQTQQRRNMKCEEMLGMLNEYVDGTVDPAFCEEFEKHMAGCNPCQVVVDNIRGTITLYQAGEPYELPIGFRDRLHSALREKWKQSPTSPTN